MPAHYGKAKGTTRPKPSPGIKPKPIPGGSGSGGNKTANKKPYVLPVKPKRPITDVPTPRDPTKVKNVNKVTKVKNVNKVASKARDKNKMNSLASKSPAKPRGRR